MSEFKRGDRVRVEYDGTIAMSFIEGFVVKRDGDDWNSSVLTEHLTKLPDPEPEWKEGDVILVGGEQTLTLTGPCYPFWAGYDHHYKSIVTHTAGWVSAQWAQGDVVRLVPEGQK